MASNDVEESRVPTNLRMLLLLEATGEMEGGTKVSDLSRILGLPRQTVHRLCATLVNEGFLIKSETGGEYRTGRRARSLASAIQQSSTAHIARRQVLEDLAADLGETINFVVPEDQGMSYKDRVETNWALRIQLPIGSHVPFHCTASGKVYLASLRKSERRRLVSVMTLKRYTENTITDTDALLEELATISRRGFSIDNQEFMEGMIASAVPVKDAAGRYFASLAFHAPLQRASLNKATDVVPTLHSAAERVSRALF